MSPSTRLCRGVSSVLLLTLGLVWLPGTVSAASGGPERGSGPSQSYSKSDDYSGHGVCAFYHEVKLGESLTAIADKYGVDLEDLARDNGIKDSDLIVENDTLCIVAHGSYDDHGRYDQKYDEYGGHDNGYQKDGYGYEKDSYGGHDDGYQKDGYGYEKDSYGGHDSGYGYGKDGYGGHDNGYGDQNHGGGYEKDGYGGHDNGYGRPNKDYEDHGYGDRYNLPPGHAEWSR